MMMYVLIDIQLLQRVNVYVAISGRMFYRRTHVAYALLGLFSFNASR